MVQALFAICSLVYSAKHHLPSDPPSAPLALALDRLYNIQQRLTSDEPDDIQHQPTSDEPDMIYLDALWCMGALVVVTLALYMVRALKSLIQLREISVEQNVRSDAANVKTDATNVQTDTANVKIEAANVQTDTANVKIEAANVQTDTSNVQTDTANVKIEAANVQTEAVTVKTDVNTGSDKDLGDMIQLLHTQWGVLKNRLESKKPM